MAMSTRERLIAIGTGLAALVFVGDRYALSPYMKAREEVETDLRTTSNKLTEANRRLARAERLDRDWKAMEAGGLKHDMSAAELQILEAVGDYAKDAGVNITSRTPQSEARVDRTQIVRLRASGKGTTGSVAKLLWRVETASIPLKVDELTLAANKPGTDDLTVTLVVSTIWVRPAEPADAKGPGGPAAPSRRGAGREEGT